MSSDDARTAARLTALREALPNVGADAAVIASDANRRYLSGFTGSAGLLLITPEHQYVLADFRYWEQVHAEARGWELVRVPRAAAFHAEFARVAREAGVRAIAFERDHVTVGAFEAWRAAIGNEATLVPCARLVEQIRAVKDVDELTAMRRATAITDAAWAMLGPWITPGTTERAVAWQIERFMREHGAEGMAFPVIVASGPNAALPHAQPTDRAIGASEPVIVDMGARVDGYCADLTRTFCLGPIPDRLLAVYQTVRAAQEHVERDLRAGMTGKAVDSLARDDLSRAGYGEAFGHSVGHSLGLEIHEVPQLSQQNDEPLPAGVVETVEPGIYLPGWGGVRIEDVVIVRPGPAEILTGAGKSMDWSE